MRKFLTALLVTTLLSTGAMAAGVTTELQLSDGPGADGLKVEYNDDIGRFNYAVELSGTDTNPTAGLVAGKLGVPVEIAKLKLLPRVEYGYRRTGPFTDTLWGVELKAEYPLVDRLSAVGSYRYRDSFRTAGVVTERVEGGFKFDITEKHAVGATYNINTRGNNAFYLTHRLTF